MVRMVFNAWLLIAFIGSTEPAGAADPANGLRIAERWCAACHVVSPDQRQASTEAMPFREMARRPGFDAAKLVFFLLHPHPVMPDLSLTRGDAEDLAAYIATLR